MFREFFWAESWRTTATAWTGMVVVVGYAFFLANVKAQLNEFYARFYDLLQKGGTAEIGSGEFVEAYEAYRAEVTSELWAFAMIIAPLVSTSPACKWARSAWAFSWRMALMRAYLVAWDTKQEPIEGASQRLHEDSQRFSSALEGCLVAVLDALFTIAVFSPILLKLGMEISSPVDLGQISGAWLLIAAFVASLVGLLGASLLGRPLVNLEVANQKVEALLRKDLVLLETTPAMIVGTPPSPNQQRQNTFLPQAYFKETLASLWTNYFLLFKHFGLLNFWLSLFDQIMVISPYLIAAPRIFSANPALRITLGTLMKMSNSFDKVFSSLSVISENWGAINDFRSTYRRLREFEAKLYPVERVGRGRLPSEVVQMNRLDRPDDPTGGTPFQTNRANEPIAPDGPGAEEPPPPLAVPASEAGVGERGSYRGRGRNRHSDRGNRTVPIHITGPDDTDGLHV